jgi:vacuolar-type H+-ATPase subunit I/STV1
LDRELTTTPSVAHIDGLGFGKGIIAVTREDWEVFLSKNEELIKRCDYLFNKLLDLRKRYDSLRAEIEEAERAKRLCEAKLLSLQEMTDKECFQSGQALSQLRSSLVQLIAQTKEELGECE